MSLVRVGDWTLDASNGTLSSDAESKRLEPKVQAVLLFLIEHRGVVVSAQDIYHEVWRDTHVAATALPRTISMLRHALEDDVRAPRYIETIPKRGYRLIASVDLVSAIDPAIEPTATAAPPSPTRRQRWTMPLVAVATLAIALAGLRIVLRPSETPAARHDSIPGPFKHETRLGNETAFEYYTRELARDPNSVKATAGLALVYAFRTLYLPDYGHWAVTAIDTARRATAIDPSDSFAASS